MLPSTLYITAAFQVATSSGLAGGTFTRKKFFDIDLTQNVAQYPLHHVTYTPFQVVTSNGLRDISTRKMTEGPTDGQLKYFGTKFIYLIKNYLRKKRV